MHPKSCAQLVLLFLFLNGCSAHHAAPPPDIRSQAIACGLLAPEYNADVQARVAPPQGWKPEPLKSSPRHMHQIWLSPTGHTAYGVIFISLPFPVGTELTLWGILQQMQRVEGKADLLSKQNDDRLPGLRFTAQGSLYTIRANLIVSGFSAWAIYAGTLNGQPVDEKELETARCARELTRINPS